MSRNRTFFVVLSVLLVLMLSIGLPVCGAPKKLRVALVLSGYLGDRSFNDSAFLGLQQAEKEFGIEYRVLESKVPSEWEQNLVAMASAGYDLVIANSTQFIEILNNNAPRFPNVKFAIIDGVVKLDNVASAIFAQNEGSFLAGAVAAMMTTRTELPGMNEEKVIGWVGGMDIPVLHDFFVGYEQGAKHIEPDIKILQSFAGTFTDPVKGKELTLAQYSQGADIVMNVASDTGNGVLEAAKVAGKYAIGVDLDQDAIYPGHIITSMLKRVDMGVYTIIKSVVDGTYKGGTVVKLGISNGGVGITDMSVMGDKIPTEIREKVKELEAKVTSGEIKVVNYPGFEIGE